MVYIPISVRFCGIRTPLRPHPDGYMENEPDENTVEPRLATTPFIRPQSFDPNVRNTVHFIIMKIP